MHPCPAMCFVAPNLTSCQGGLWRYHVSYSSGPRLPTEVGSNATTCLVAPGLSSQLRRALTLPRIPWVWTPPPC
jgi:hypothetical protein